jgi:hypothetical protein
MMLRVVIQIEKMQCKRKSIPYQRLIPLKMWENYNISHNIKHYILLLFCCQTRFTPNTRIVTGGHLIDLSTGGIFLSIVSLKRMLIAIAAADVSNLEIMVGEISHLELYTKKKVIS